jgi:rhamnosyltransferase
VKVEEGIRRFAVDASVLGVVVLFQPPPGCVDALVALSPQVKELVVYDNTPGGTIWDDTRRLGALSNLRWLGDGQNRGIAFALNRALDVAAELGVEWVISFDQDTRVQGDYVAKMLEGASAGPGGPAPAMVVPGLPGDGLGTGRGEVPRAITSGALSNVAALAAVGGYWEELFIDYVDFELCIRLRRAGHRIVRLGDIRLQHCIGSPTFRNVAGLRVTSTNHSAIRRYYKCRNRIALVREHFCSAPAWLLRELLATFWEAGKIALFEEDRGAKLRMMAQGIRDGAAGRLGPGPVRPDPLERS